ncbi:MAG: hypothetical protein JW940_14205 [Polyangiaceae bacterium]|nr:hypothetical protein [Polyangiaceae bacterium]
MKTMVWAVLLGVVGVCMGCSGDGSKPDSDGSGGSPSTGAAGPGWTGTGASTSGGGFASGGGFTARGGSTAAGGRGGSDAPDGGLSCQSANDTGRNADCTEFGAGYYCDRSDATRDPRTCTCTDNGAGALTWVCTHLSPGTGGGGGRQAGGG